MKQKIFIVLASIAILVVFIILIQQSRTEESAQSSTPSGIPIPAQRPSTIPRVLYNISGTVTEITADFLVIEAVVIELDEEGQPVQKTEVRKTLFTSATQFTRLLFVTQEGTNRKTPQETQIGIGELQIGDSIEVFSKQDISSKEEFEVTKVRILAGSI